MIRFRKGGSQAFESLGEESCTRPKAVVWGKLAHFSLHKGTLSKGAENVFTSSLQESSA